MADYKQAYFCGYEDEAGIRLGMGETARKLRRLAVDMGETERQLQLQAEALDALSRAMELLDGKELAEARLLRGRLYLDMRQHDTAKEDLKAAVAMDDSHIPLLYECATLLARSERPACGQRRIPAHYRCRP